MVTYIADTIDFAEMTTTGGVRGFICRALFGTAEDASYLQWIQQIRTQTAVPWGSYHFLHPSANPILQAQLFVDLRVPGDLGDWLDVETGDYPDPTWDMVRLFIAEYERLTGNANIGIYTNVGTWEGAIKWYDPSFAVNHPLWVANWGVDKPSIPRPWKEYQIWQYGAERGLPGYTYVPGENSAGVDVNVWGDQ